MNDRPGAPPEPPPDGADPAERDDRSGLLIAIGVAVLAATLALAVGVTITRSLTRQAGLEPAPVVVRPAVEAVARGPVVDAGG